MRNRGPRESSRFSGSFSIFNGVATPACRYAAEVTISLYRCFTSHPLSRNSTASQSSSSGCEGGSPCDPKSSEVLTSPVPNSSCHIRFTATRAVSGCAGSTSHLASPSRFFGSAALIGGSAYGVLAASFSRG